MKLYTREADSFLIRLKRKMIKKGIEFDQGTKNPHMIKFEVESGEENALIHFQAQTQSDSDNYHSGRFYPKKIVISVLEELKKEGKLK